MGLFFVSAVGRGTYQAPPKKSTSTFVLHWKETMRFTCLHWEKTMRSACQKEKKRRVKEKQSSSWSECNQMRLCKEWTSRRFHRRIEQANSFRGHSPESGTLFSFSVTAISAHAHAKSHLSTPTKQQADECITQWIRKQRKKRSSKNFLLT